MFQRTSIKSKLMIAFTFSASIAVFVGVMAYYFSRNAIDAYRAIAKQNVPNLVVFIDMKAALTSMVVPVASLVGTPSTPQDAAKAQADLDKAIAKFDKTAKEYEDLPFAEGEEAFWKEARSSSGLLTKFIDTSKEMIRLSGTTGATTKADQAQRDKMWDNEYAQLIKDKEAAFEQLSKFETDSVAKSEKSGDSLNTQMVTVVSIVVALGFLLSLGVGYLIATFLSKNINAVANELNMGFREVADASQQLSQASQQLASGASSSAASLEEGVASIEELSSTVKMNAGNAQQAASLSTQVSQQAGGSLQEMEKLLSCMMDIQKSSQRVEEIIGVIDDLAFQTNLLALNASVEAARAGEQGRGFSVVAEAVRSLAQKSATSAKDISDLIKQSTGQVKDGVEIAQGTSSSLNQLTDFIKKISDLNQEIASASSEQSTGVNQLSTAMNSLDKTVQGNAASSEEVAASTEELTSQASNMTASVQRLIALVEGAGRTEEAHGASVLDLHSYKHNKRAA